MRLALQGPDFTCPDSIGEQVQERLPGRGLDAVTVNIPAHGHRPEVVARAGEILTRALS